MTVLAERRTLRSSLRATSVVGLKMSTSMGPDEGGKGPEKKARVGRKVVPVTNDPLPDVTVTKKRVAKSGASIDEQKVEASVAAKPALRGRKNKTPPVAEDEEGEVILTTEGGSAEGQVTRPRKRVAKEKKPQEPVAEASTGKVKGKGKGKGKGKEEKTLAGLQPEKERKLHSDGYDWVYGVDEAGRGPLAGPVVTACCYVPPDLDIPGIMDSKQMDEEAREAAFALLTSTKGVLYAISVVDNRRIDEINILQATLQGMRECVEECVAKHKPKDKIYALVDGNRDPKLCVPAELMIKGDTRIRCIAAASILAKVTRDRLMLEIDAQYPQYGFAQHKGYPTPSHKMALHKHGPCPLHRMTFKPIRKD